MCVATVGVILGHVDCLKLIVDDEEADLQLVKACGYKIGRRGAAGQFVFEQLFVRDILLKCIKHDRHR